MQPIQTKWSQSDQLLYAILITHDWDRCDEWRSEVEGYCGELVYNPLHARTSNAAIPCLTNTYFARLVPRWSGADPCVVLARRWKGKDYKQIQTIFCFSFPWRDYWIVLVDWQLLIMPHNIITMSSRPPPGCFNCSHDQSFLLPRVDVSTSRDMVLCDAGSVLLWTKICPGWCLATTSCSDQTRCSEYHYDWPTDGWHHNWTSQCWKPQLLICWPAKRRRKDSCASPNFFRLKAARHLQCRIKQGAGREKAPKTFLDLTCKRDILIYKAGSSL